MTTNRFITPPGSAGRPSSGSMWPGRAASTARRRRNMPAPTGIARTADVGAPPQPGERRRSAAARGRPARSARSWSGPAAIANRTIMREGGRGQQDHDDRDADDEEQQPAGRRPAAAIDAVLIAGRAPPSGPVSTSVNAPVSALASSIMVAGDQLGEVRGDEPDHAAREQVFDARSGCVRRRRRSWSARRRRRTPARRRCRRSSTDRPVSACTCGSAVTSGVRSSASVIAAMIALKHVQDRARRTSRGSVEQPSPSRVSRRRCP